MVENWENSALTRMLKYITKLLPADRTQRHGLHRSIQHRTQPAATLWQPATPETARQLQFCTTRLAARASKTHETRRRTPYSSRPTVTSDQNTSRSSIDSITTDPLLHRNLAIIDVLCLETDGVRPRALRTTIHLHNAGGATAQPPRRSSVAATASPL